MVLPDMEILSGTEIFPGTDLSSREWARWRGAQTRCANTPSIIRVTERAPEGTYRWIIGFYR